MSDTLRIVIEGENRDLVAACVESIAAIKGVDRAGKDANKTQASFNSELRRTRRDSSEAARAVNALDGAVARLNRNATFTRNVLGALKWPTYAAGAGMLAAELAQVAAGLAAIAAGAGPAIGVLASVGQGATAAVQAIGTVKLATSGVTDAVKAQTAVQQQAGQASASSAEKQRNAANTIANAHDGLVGAQDRARDAQRRLTVAREEAKAELEDLQRTLNRTALSERGAEIALREAIQRRRELRNDPTASLLGLDQADQAVSEARAQLSDTRRERQSQTRELDTAQRKGVDRSQKVVDAQRQVTDANRQAAAAARAFAEAQHDAAVATGAQSAAATKAQQALAKLSPEARHFVKTVVDMQPELAKLRAAAGEDFWPGVEKGLLSANRNFDVLRGTVKLTGGELGDAAEQWGAFLGSKDFGADLKSIGEANAKVIDRGSRSALSLAHAFTDITVAAEPLTDWLSRITLKASEGIEKWAETSRRTGEAKRFFEETREVLTVLGDITGDVAHSVREIGRAGYDTGRELLDELSTVTQHWRDWTTSVDGQNELRAYFEHAKPAVEETGGLIADVTKMLFKLGAQDGTAELIHQMRDELLPAVETLLGNLSQGFGPAFVHSVTSLVKLFADLSDADGGLTVTVKLLGDVAEGVRWLIDQGGPGLKNALGVSLAAVSLYKLLGIGAAIKGILKLRALLKTTPAAAATQARTATATGMLLLGAPPVGMQGRTPGGLILPPGVRSVDQQGKPIAPVPAAPVPSRFAGGLSKTLTALPFIGAAVIGAGAAAEGLNDRRARKSRDFEAEQIRKIATTSKDAAEAMRRLNGERRQLQSVVENAGKIGIDAEGIKRVRMQIEAVDAALARFGTNGPKSIGDVGSALKASQRMFDDWRKTGSLNLKGLHTVTAQTTADIKHRLSQDTLEGKDALARNFRQAAAEVKKSMDAGQVSTRDGLREIKSLMRKALGVYGIKGNQADNYLREGNVGSFGENDRAKMAGGGWIGNPGERGRDEVDITVGRGEAILNADQQNVAQQALAVAHSVGAVPYGDLDSMFAGEQRPHYLAGYAKGGRVGLQPAVKRLGDQLTRQFGLSVTSTTGGGHAAGSYHYQGLAEDLAGAPGAMAAASRYLITSGAYRSLLEGIHNPGLSVKDGKQVPPGFWGGKTWADHGDHIHLALRALGAIKGGGGSSIDEIKRVKWTGPGGAIGQIGQAGLNRVRAGANAALARVGGSSAGGGGDLDVKGASGKGASEAQARAWIAQGLRVAGQPVTAAAVNTLLGRARQESGLNPRAINLWDSNAKKGIPSKGFLQTIGPTFNRYKVKGHDDIYDPVDNVAAAVRYMLATYGHLVGAGKGGYAKGGRVRRGAARGRAASLKARKGTGRGKPFGGRGRARYKLPLQALKAAESLTTTAGDRDIDLGLLIRQQDRTDESATKSGRVQDLTDPELLTVYTQADIARLRQNPGERVDIVDQPAISQHVGELAARLNIKNEIAGLLKQRREALAGAVDELNKGIKERNAALKALRDKLKANIARIERLRKQITSRREDLKKLRARKAPRAQIADAEGDIRRMSGQVDDLQTDNRRLSTNIDTRERQLGTWTGELEKAAPDLKSSRTDVTGVEIDAGEIQDEINRWLRTSVEKIDVAGLTAGGDSGRAELLAQQLEEQRRSNALQGQQLGVFSGFAQLLAGRFVGAFAHGGPVLQTGMALVHRGERITVDPDGPYGNRAGGRGGGDRPVDVQLTLTLDTGGLIQVVDARVDQRAATVVSQDLGRRQRLITSAPGRPRGR